MSNSILTGKTLSVAKAGRWIFHGVDLELAPSEVVVVVGPSGGGKSTLLRTLAGLERPDGGSVERRGPVGVLFQEPALFDFDGLTVGENMSLASSQAPQDTVALLDAVGLPAEIVARPPRALSGGQKRRVAIARALAARPAALLYDEPTAGLDSASAALIAGLIRRTATERQLAAVVVTHDMETAVHVGDRVLSLVPGGGLVPVLDRGSSRPGVDPISPEGRALIERVRGALAAPGTPPERPPPPPPRPEGFAWAAPFAAVGAAVCLLAGSLSVAREGAIRRRLFALLPGAVGLALLGCTAVGLVVALQTAAALGRFEARHLLPEVAAVSMVRQVLPLLVGLLLAGRIGAAVAAEIGSYSLSGQITALELLGHRPARFLAAPLVWAVGIVVPIATLAGLAAGVAGLLAGAVGLLGLKGSLVLAGLERGVRAPDVAIAVGKGIVFGLAIAVASYRHGVGPKSDPAALGDGATRGVVEASIAVVLLDSLIGQLATLMR